MGELVSRDLAGGQHFCLDLHSEAFGPVKNFQIFSQKFFPLHQVPVLKAGSFSGPSSKKELETIAKELKASKESVKSLEKFLEIWVKQPAQHFIPWRKDHFGLNISEALELWKGNALGE